MTTFETRLSAVHILQQLGKEIDRLKYINELRIEALIRLSGLTAGGGKDNGGI